VTNGDLDPGMSVRFGPVQDKDVEMKDADAHALSKRKSRASIDKKKSYAEPESSEDDQPLVRYSMRL
jgi:DNA topoisomerase I